MKKILMIVSGLLAAGYFIILFFIAGGLNRKTDHEIQKIHAASKAVIKVYLRETSPPDIKFPSNPLFIDKDECILVGILPDGGSPGKRNRKFIIFLERQNRTWRARIIKVKPWPHNLPATRPLRGIHLGSPASEKQHQSQ